MISIIIPIYNAKKYLNRCLNSILYQKYENYEVLMINDGSTDGSDLICLEFQNKDNRFKLITKDNGGSATARNTGLDLAKGDHIVFVDADDYIDKNYLLDLHSTMVKTKSDIVQCEFQITYIDNELERKQNNNFRIIDKHEMFEMFCNKKTYLSVAVLWNKIYKKELFNGLRFPINKGIDDEYLICQIINNSSTIAILNSKLYYYFMSENSQMRNSKPSLKKIDNIDALEMQLSFFYDNNMKDIYNMLLYRYNACVISGYNYVKKYFPNEIELKKCLKKKRKKWIKVLFTKNINIHDKLLLIIRRFFPRIFNFVHRGVR